MRTGPGAGASAFARVLAHHGGARTALALVLALGALSGHFLWRTLVAPRPTSYALTWSAPWMAYPTGDRGTAYFRHRIFLDASPRHAWIQVAAIDRFELWLNGKPVGNAERPGSVASGVYDLGSKLQAGENVIAIASATVTWPGTARVAIEGQWIDAAGIIHGLRSNRGFRASTLAQLDPAAPRWSGPLLDDEGWQPVELLGVPDRGAESRVPFPPALLQSRGLGGWSWPADESNDRAFVRLSFEAPSSLGGAWLEIAAGDAWELFVNGVALAHREPVLRGSRARASESAARIDLVDISAQLRAGRNLVALAATAAPSARALSLSARLFDRNGRSIGELATPHAARARTSPERGWTRAGHDDAHWSVLRAAPAPLAATGVAVAREMRAPDPELVLSPRRVGTRAGLLLVVTLALGALWLGVGLAIARRSGVAPELGLALQATPLAWATATLLLALLMGCDVRLGPDFPYRPAFLALSLILLLAGQLRLLARLPEPVRVSDSRPRSLRLAFALAAAALALGGLALRLRDVSLQPLTGDEVTMAMVSDAVWRYGFPVGDVASNLPLKYLTTSEVVPYPMALWIGLFGLDERGVRMNGIVFGALGVLLLALAGRDLFDRRTGLLAALLFAFLPYAVKMSHYARYPSQLAFFTLLTVWLTERALRGARADSRGLMLATLSAALTYLSWEGAAFLGPSVLVGLVVYKRRDLAWLREPRLWLAALAMAGIVLVQLGARMQLNADWPRLGIGVSQLTPTLLWNQPLYDPWSYVWKFFALENLQVVSLLALAGLVSARDDRRLGYLLAILIATPLLMTNLLETQDTRHVYHLTPLLLLAGARSFWRIADGLTAFAVQAEPARGLAPRVSRLALLALFLLSANTWVLRLYDLPGNHNAGEARLEARRPGGTSIAFAGESGAAPPRGALVSYQPHVARFYLGRADYYLESRLQIPVAVDLERAIAVHRVVGTPLLYTLSDLDWALGQDPRAVVIAPESGLKLVSEDARELLGRRMKVIYEDARVRLYSNDAAAGRELR